MRILQLISTLKIGGAQKLQVTLAAATQTRPVEMVVASLNDDTNSPNLPLLQAEGRRVEHFPANKLFHLQRLQRLIQFVRAEQFDLIHSHLTYANILAPIVGRATGLPVIGTLHNVKIEARHYHPLREGWLEPMALRYGTRCVVAVGRMAAEAYRDRLRGQRVVVIPNAVSPIPSLPEAERLALRQTFMDDATRPLLLAVGRISEQKGYTDLLEAFVQVRATHPAAFLAIAGGGDGRAALQQHLERLGLTGQAVLLGARADVPQLLRASDLFVSASLWEGLPVAVLEAMSAELPVVATGVGDVPYVLVNDTGVVVPPSQPAQLAAAVRSLLDDPARRAALGQAARAHAEKNYGPAAWLDQHLVLYADVLRRAGKSP